MHIVDASGRTDEGGKEIEGGHDPVRDVTWIHHELQRWIRDNLKAKWDGVVRKPQHIYDMFTGYQAPSWLVHEGVYNITSRNL